VCGFGADWRNIARKSPPAQHAPPEAEHGDRQASGPVSLCGFVRLMARSRSNRGRRGSVIMLNGAE
jgi:hypothetical protein